MTNERSIDELVEEFNARAKAEGRYDGRAFWEVPSQSGSIVNIPETPESSGRVSRLHKRIAELKQAVEGPGPAEEIPEVIGDAVRAQLLLQEKAQAEQPAA